MKNGAFKPPQYDASISTAVQQMEQGECEPHLQIKLLNWLIVEACKTYDLSYRPGDTHDTAFAEGRRFVGLELVKMLKLEPGKLRRDENG
jgi:hypothetical protein